MSDLSDFSDAHHLERLRQSLWSGQAIGRAAVLVGAGFSRNAERVNPASPPLPDFKQLATEMWGELNNLPGLNAPQGLDPIELASEYEGIFHRKALNDFLRRKLVDAAHRPTRLHRLLLSLPWADVFTTNWDTLLERAASDIVDRQYSVVATTDALVGSQRPRIVKLHGSFPDRLPLIITKEDFRCYPRTHAAFVNTVQQAVMECSLCLIGFGGSDPNFLAWSGWVHDNLGDSAPPIYLAGVLELNVRQRTYLEHRRVLPIDLAALFPRGQWPIAQTRHQAANEWLLLNLARGEPDPITWPLLTRREATGAWKPDPSWPPMLNLDAPQTHSPPNPAQPIIDIMNQYPGWITCPESARFRLELLFRENWALMNSGLQSSERTIALSAWLTLMRATEILRANVSSSQLGHLRSCLEAWNDATDEWFELARLYVAQLRYADQWHEHQIWLDRLLETHVESELRQAYLRREQVLAGLARLDLVMVKQALKEWPPISGSFQLELARAAAFGEVNAFSEAARIVESVLHSIRTIAVPVEGKLNLLSLEGVAMASHGALVQELRKYKWETRSFGRYRELARWGCNPAEYFEAAEHDLRQVPLDQGRITKSFDVAQYVVHWSFASKLDEYRDKASAALRLFEAFSIPFRCGHVTYHVDLAVAAAKIVAPISPTTAFSIFVRADSQEALGDTFDMLFVARLSPEAIVALDEMASRFISEHELSGEANSDRRTEGPLAVAFELRSRLVARLSQKRVETIIRDALVEAKQEQILDRLCLAPAVLNCIVRGFEALPRSARELLVIDLLQIPLPIADRPAVGTHSWEDPIRKMPLPEAISQRVRDTWERAIEELLLVARTADSEQRWEALARLVKLHMSENLTHDQSIALANVFWSQGDMESIVAGLRYTHFSLNVMLELPDATEQCIGEKLRNRLLTMPFPPTDGQPGSEHRWAEESARYHFNSMNHVFQKLGSPLNQDEAMELLGQLRIWLVAHQARENHRQTIERQNISGDDVLSAYIELLNEHILPSINFPIPLVTETLSEIRERLAIEPVSTLVLEHQFQRLSLTQPQESIANLRRGLRSSKDIEVTSAASGIVDWLAKDGHPPRELLQDFIAVLQRPGPRSFPIILGIIAHFVNKYHEQITQAEVEQLATTLNVLHDETDVTKEQNDRLYQDPAWMPDARYSATYLAAVL